MIKQTQNRLLSLFLAFIFIASFLTGVQIAIHSIVTTPTAEAATNSDLSIVASVFPTGTVNRGDSLLYTLTVTNTASTPLVGAQVVDTLDTDLTFSGTGSCSGTYTNCVYTPATRTLVWNIDQINGGETVTLNFQAIATGD